MLEAAKFKLTERIERDTAQRGQLAARYRKLSNDLENPDSKQPVRKASPSRELAQSAAVVTADAEEPGLSL